MNKTTAAQMFMIMTLSRIFVTIMYIPPTNEKFYVSDLMVQILIGFVSLIITAFPIYLLMRSNNNSGFLERCSNVSGFFGKLASLLLLLGILFFSLRTLLRFELFVTTVIFPGADLRFFLVLMALSCLYAAVMGMSVIGRVTEMFFALVILCIVFVLASTAGRIEFTNFTPFLYGGIESPLKTGLLSMGVTIELMYPIMLKDKITGNSKACIYPWIVSNMAFLFIIMFWQAGVLGDYANTQLFPFFSLTALTTIGFLERLDAVLTAVWIVSVFVKISMFIHMGGMCLRTMFKPLSPKKSLYVMGAGLVIMSIFIKETVTMHAILSDITGIVITFVVIAVVLPVILLSCEKCMDEKENGAEKFNEKSIQV